MSLSPLVILNLQFPSCRTTLDPSYHQDWGRGQVGPAVSSAWGRLHVVLNRRIIHFGGAESGRGDRLIPGGASRSGKQKLSPLLVTPAGGGGDKREDGWKPVGARDERTCNARPDIQLAFWVKLRVRWSENLEKKLSNEKLLMSINALTTAPVG